MGAKRKPDVIDEKRVELVRLGERRKQRLTQVPNDRIVEGAPMAKIPRANASFADVLGNLLERSARKIGSGRTSNCSI
jgi:hypothetical protein